MVIGDRRIVSCDDGKVTFTYRTSGSNRSRNMTLDAMEFIRRFLQHVLPGGFRKVRHYGFASANSAQSIESIRWLMALHDGRIFLLLVQQAAEPPLPRLRCTACGAAIRVIGFAPSAAPSYFDTS